MHAALLERFGPMGYHTRWGAALLLRLFAFGLFAGLVALVVVLIVRSTSTSRSSTHVAPPGPPGWHAATPDAALEHLRVRYARGEISRDEYLRVAADLGAPVPAAATHAPPAAAATPAPSPAAATPAPPPAPPG